MKENINGININNQGYIIDVAYCKKADNYCILKINGVSTDKLYNSEINDSNKKTEFILNDDYTLRIKSIIFDYCDGKRFCDYHFDAYDVIEIEIEG